MNAVSAEDEVARSRFDSMFGNPESIFVSLTGRDFTSASSGELLDEFSRKLSLIEGVRAVTTLNSFDVDSESEGSLRVTPAEVDAVANQPDFMKVFLSEDQQTAGVNVEIVKHVGGVDYRDEILSKIYREVAELPPGLTSRLTGVVIQKDQVTKLIQRDQLIVFPVSLLVLVISLFALFRTVWGILAPLLVMGMSLTWTMGLYAWLDFPLNSITSLLPPVVMVLAIATSVHLYQSWVEIAATVKSREEASSAMLRRLMKPCSFTALTTSVGLAALYFNETPAVQLFGLFGAFGVLSAYIISITLLPALFLYIPRGPHMSGNLSTDRLSGLLHACARVTVAAPRRVLAAATVLTAGALALIPAIQNDTDLVRFLKPSNVLYQDTMFVDDHLAGSTTIDLMVSRQDGDALSLHGEDSRLGAFCDWLKTRGAVSAVISGLPQLEVPAASMLLNSHLSKDGQVGRITLFLKAIGTAEGSALLKEIESEGRRRLKDDYRVEPAGTFYHVIRDSSQLVSRQVKSFLLSLMLALTAIGILFRSLKLVFVALVPNVIPIIWTGGLMALLGIHLSTGTAMIASVAIGIAIDDTIYYLAGFQSRKASGTLVDVLKETTIRTGRPLVISSVVLTMGFWCGGLGSFMPTIYFALLTGVTMLSALACDLVLLPSCLILSEQCRERRCSKPSKKALNHAYEIS